VIDDRPPVWRRPIGRLGEHLDERALGMRDAGWVEADRVF
jgi:hypothetical protein